MVDRRARPGSGPAGASAMRDETAGITRANETVAPETWNILGQTYVAKSITDRSFSWHATFPPGTFVPPHTHPGQDEYLYILEGELALWLDGEDAWASPGDTVRLPMGRPHGIFNRSDATARCLFWVAPTGSLPDLFRGIHAMAEQSPDAVVVLAARHGVEFLPPPG